MRVFVDLGKTPLAGEFLKKDEVGKEKFYPLKLYECLDCSLVQLEKTVPRERLFQSFLSSVSMKQHFFQYAWEMASRFLKKGDFVVEIGSNDGTLLKPLQKLGMKVLGIEPVIKIAEISKKKGIPTWICYFSTIVAKEIGKKADMVLANNVLAHIEDMDEVMKGIKMILKDDGILVFEVHYLLDLVEKLQYDTIYHEHINYYSIASLAPFLKKYGFEIFEVKRVPTHAGSIRVYAKQLSDEKIESFNDDINLQRYKFVSQLKRLKRQHRIVIGYGAAGRANTLLNYCHITPDLISCIVDESPLRYGRFTPGTHIPVVSPKKVDFKKVDYVVILAWNYEKEIREKLKKSVIKFIIPLPRVKIDD
jgi:SAM-dependent methyltransferase